MLAMAIIRGASSLILSKARKICALIFTSPSIKSLVSIMVERATSDERGSVAGHQIVENRSTGSPPPRFTIYTAVVHRLLLVLIALDMHIKMKTTIKTKRNSLKLRAIQIVHLKSKELWR